MFKRFYSSMFVAIGIVSFCQAGVITGVVTNAQTDKPLPGTYVEVEISGKSAITDSAGVFRIDSIQPGSWNLIYYNDIAEPVHRNDLYVPGDGEVRADMELNPKVYALDKMVVHGHSFRRPTEMASSSKMISSDELLRAPGALVDVQRVVQELPSVASAADNTNEIIVRGGTPGENLMLIDNIEVPNPNHFANQGSGGGVVSLVNPLLVKNLTFCAGAPPAQYGGKASSVLDVKLRDGNDKMVIGGVDLGISGAGFHVEGPMGPGNTFMASATKSFLDLASNYEKVTAIPQYWGFQAKVAHAGEKDRISGNVIFGNDAIQIDDAQAEAGTEGERIYAGGMMYAAGTSWERFWGERLSTTLTISGVGNSFDRREYTDNAGVTDSFFVNKSLQQEQSAKLSGSLTFMENSKLTAGVEVKRCDFDIDVWNRPDTERVYAITDSTDTGSIVLDGMGNPIVYFKSARGSAAAYKFGAFVSCVVNPLPRVRLIPGVRWDAFTYNKSSVVSPRLGLVYSLSPDLDLTGSFGVQYQDPEYVDLLAAPLNHQLKPKQATNGVVGAEYLWSSLSTKFTLETFYKKYSNLPVDSALLSPDSLDESDVLFSTGEGRSYGVEFFAQKKLTNHFSGSFSYSYSRSDLKDLRPGCAGEWYPGDYDFRNSLTLTAGYKEELINRSWYKELHKQLWFALFSPIMPIADRIELSAKWRFLGGRPYTNPEWDDLHQKWIINQEHLNNARYDNYHKLDVRFERRFGFGFLQMIYYFDLQNVYNKDNVWTYVYSDNKSDGPTPIYQFHFFPAGGVIIGF